MKGKSALIALITAVALALLVWEIVHSVSVSRKEKKKLAEASKPVVPATPATASSTWKQYTIVRRSVADSAIEKIISAYPPKPDTLYPAGPTAEKALRLFEDTLKRSRICVFRPTSPDGKYGDWIILADSSKMMTRYNAVKIDSTVTAGSKKIIIMKKERTNAVLRDTINL